MITSFRLFPLVAILLLLPATAARAQWVVSGTETIANPGTPLPASVNDPVMWLDASDISSLVLSGNHISSWGDLSGNGNSVNQAALGNQPTIGINPSTGHAAVFFDGRDVISNTFNVGTPYTIFTASNQAGSLNARLITSTSNNWLLGYWGGGENRMFAEGWVLGSGGPAATTNPHFYGATGSGSNTTFYDGTTQLASNANGTAAPNGISLGAWQNNPGSEPSRGYVSELIVFDRVLSAAEINDLNTYLQSKWSGQGQVPDNTDVIVTAGNTLAIDNTAETIGTLSGDGAVTLSNAVLGLGGGGGSGTFSGTISGDGGIAKVGTGTQSLSGINTYTGGTQVHQGTLDLGASGNVGSATSQSNIGSHLGAGTLAISGGSLQASSLTLGAEGPGTLNISGGTVSTNAQTGFGSLVVGLYHAGVVNQTGGTVSVNASHAILGRYAGSSAVYNLSGGSFSQSTGTHFFMAWDHSSVTAELNISGPGQFILTGGNLEAGGQGTATINQTGGSVSISSGELRLGSQNNATSSGIYNISAGTLQQNGGRLRMAQSHASSTAELNVSGTAQVILNGAVLEVGEAGTATVNQSGGLIDVQNNHIVVGRNANSVATVNLSGDAVMQTSGGSGNRDFYMGWNQAGSQGTLNIQDDATLSVVQNFNAANQGSAIINQSAGTVTVGGSVNLANQNAPGNATLNLIGGTFTSNGDLNMARTNAGAEATLNVSGGTLTINGARLEATPLGTATVNHSGGTINVVNSHIVIGRLAGGTATVNLSGDAVMQTSGTSGARDIYLGWDQAGAQGTLNIQDDATLSVVQNFNAANQGTATVNQSGGTVTVGGNVNLATQNNANGNATLNLSGGSFSTGGALNMATANAGANAELNVTGGALNVAGALNAANQGTATITQSAGTTTITGATNLATANVGANATLNLDGGLYSTTRITTGNGTATINFDGGTLRTTADHHNAATTNILAGGGTFDVAGTSYVSLTQDLHGTGDLTKTGTGTLVLRDGHSHTGAVIIESGTVALASATQPDLLFTFDSASGNTVANHGALNLDGTLTFGATLTGGGGGRNGSEALAIANNTSQHLQVGTSGADHDTTYTVAGWFQDLHSGNWRTFSRGSATDHHIIFDQNSDRLGAFIGGFRDSGATFAPGNPADPDWTHIAVVADGTTSTYYLNGAAVGSTPWVSNADVFAIGNIQQSGNFQPFASKIDDFTMFNHALSPAEIAQLASDTYTINHNTNILADDKPLAIASAGTLDLRGNSETIGSLIDSGSLGGGTVTNSLASAPATLTIGADNSNATFSGRLTGDLSLVKTGTGNQTLSGMSAYTGPTTVAGGTLLVNGSIIPANGSSSLTVASGATLGGNGQIGSAANPVAVSIGSGGILAPGNSPDTLTLFGDLTLNAGSIFDVDLAFGGFAGAGNGTIGTDRLVVDGGINLDGALLTGTWGGDNGNLFRGTPDSDNMLWLMLNQTTDPINGTFANTTPGGGFAGLFNDPLANPYLATIDGQLFALFYDADFATSSFSGGNDLLLTAIPEPSRALLLAMALGSLLLRRRR